MNKNYQAPVLGEHFNRDNLRQLLQSKLIGLAITGSALPSWIEKDIKLVEVIEKDNVNIQIEAEASSIQLTCISRETGEILFIQKFHIAVTIEEDSHEV